MNPFALAYREQQQLFMFDKAYLMGTLLKVGGLAALLARFIVQFFWNPTVALVITVLLLALSSYMTWVAFRRDRKDWIIIPLCLVPACFIGLSLADNSLHFEYFTAILLVLAALIISKGIRNNRPVWGVLLTIFLYLSAGPAAILFVVCAACSHFRPDRESLGLWPMLYPVTAAACGAVMYLSAAVPTWSNAFTPSFYYDLDASMPVVHWVAWGALVAVSLVAGRKYKPVFFAGAVLLLAAVFFAGRITRSVEKQSTLASYEYEYYVANEKWDDLISSCRHHEWSFGTANYLNLALSQKGILTEDLLKYDQRGAASLIFMPPEKTVDVRLAHIMFAMGNMAAAQDVAFNALNTMTGYSPAMLKMNAEIEFMRGSYEVADKYLSLLAKSPHYKKWASDRHRFLWNDDAVETDPLLGAGRKDFPKEDGFSMFGNPIDELAKVVDANPSDKRAMDYYLSFLLLTKDIERLYKVVDNYWGAQSLQELPEAVQEALLFYSEYTRNFSGEEPVSPEWCMYHGVTSGTADRFRAFQQASLVSGGKTAPKGFHGTYWNYLLYTEI